jgi:hypothetical protein
VYQIEFSPDVENHLRVLTSLQEKKVMDGIEATTSSAQCFDKKS